MSSAKKDLRVCNKGHRFYKSSNCRTCPTCELENKPDSGFLSLLSAPARRALVHNGVTSLEELSKFSEKEILKFHGIGPASIPTLKSSLERESLSFRN
ncbi:MAG: RNA polymerase alpha subunit C-terminal domain-containing protein [Psychrobacillus psychrodurans]